MQFKYVSVLISVFHHCAASIVGEWSDENEGYSSNCGRNTWTEKIIRPGFIVRYARPRLTPVVYARSPVTIIVRHEAGAKNQYTFRGFSVVFVSPRRFLKSVHVPFNVSTFHRFERFGAGPIVPIYNSVNSRPNQFNSICKIPFEQRSILSKLLVVKWKMWELKQYKLFKVYKYWHFNENLSNYGKEDDKTVCKQITEIPNHKAEAGVRGSRVGRMYRATRLQLVIWTKDVKNPYWQWINWKNNISWYVFSDNLFFA